MHSCTGDTGTLLVKQMAISREFGHSWPLPVSLLLWLPVGEMRQRWVLWGTHHSSLRLTPLEAQCSALYLRRNVVLREETHTLRYGADRFVSHAPDNVLCRLET